MVLEEEEMVRIRVIGIVLGFFAVVGIAYAQKEEGFSQEDRERLIRLETTLKVFMEQVDKRFEQIDKRFEQVNQQFEQIDKRFEQVNQQFEQMMSFLWMLTGIFTTLVVAVIGFAYWDRRTVVRKARDEAIEVIEKEGRLRDLIAALRQLAREDPKLAEVLRHFHRL